MSEREANAKLKSVWAKVEAWADLDNGDYGSQHPLILMRQALLAAKQDEGKKTDSRCPCWPGCEAADEGNG